MSYIINKILSEGTTFDETKQNISKELKKEGFAVLTNIDVKAILKSKINKDINKYEILGACNPTYAYESLQVENKSGLFMPCNFVIQENMEGLIEVSAINPAASMGYFENEALEKIMKEVKDKLQNVINNL